jgi:hypothetical protein
LTSVNVPIAIQLLTLTCSRFAGPIFAGKFQFSGMTDSGRWTRKP